MLLYYITDRRALGGEAALLRHIGSLGDSVDMIQVREKDREARDLARLVREIIATAHPRVRIFVNGRADVALACGAHGVHLRGEAISVLRLRSILPAEFQVSVSCHSLEDVRRASLERADFAVLGPIFESPGKGLPLGLETLREAARVSTIPVLALGGIEPHLIAPCMEAGAAGIAAIRLFQSPEHASFWNRASESTRPPRSDRSGRDPD